MKRLLILSTIILCAFSDFREASLSQATLDYKTDNDTLDALTEDYEANPDFLELMMQIPHVFGPYQQVLRHGQKLTDKQADEYIEKVSWLTECVSELDESVMERLPVTCERIRKAPLKTQAGQQIHP